MESGPEYNIILYASTPLPSLPTPHLLHGLHTVNLSRLTSIFHHVLHSFRHFVAFKSTLCLCVPCKIKKKRSLLLADSRTLTRLETFQGRNANRSRHCILMRLNYPIGVPWLEVDSSTYVIIRTMRCQASWVYRTARCQDGLFLSLLWLLLLMLGRRLSSRIQLLQSLSSNDLPRWSASHHPQGRQSMAWGWWSRHNAARLVRASKDVVSWKVSTSVIWFDFYARRWQCAAASSVDFVKNRETLVLGSEKWRSEFGALTYVGWWLGRAVEQ